MDDDTSSTETIFALSSAPGRAGVAVVRVSGPKAQTLAHDMVGPAGRPLEPRRARFARIKHPLTGALLDEGIAVWFPAPQSFTGEDIVEFQVHGGRAVVNAVLEALSQMDGCRIAEPGEFTRRAFEAGKIDLTQVEGIADLVDADTDAQRVQALGQAGGALLEIFDTWRAELIRARAKLEAAIDFSDEEDVAQASTVGVADDVSNLLEQVDGHLAGGYRGEIIRYGFKVVLAGPPNVGKSSLLNALAQRDAAIVSAEAGTTRDVVEVRIDLGGFAVIVSDTAGIREAAGDVEAEGIRRTVSRVEDADLVLWMIDLASPGAPPPPEVLAKDGRAVVVFTKIDLVGAPKVEEVLRGWPDDARHWFERAGAPVSICARRGDTAGIDGLTERLTKIVADRAGDAGSPVLTQARHRAHLVRCAGYLREFVSGDGAGAGGEVELQAELLRLASDALGRITGRVDVEDVLDDVFGQFCIGK